MSLMWFKSPEELFKFGAERSLHTYTQVYAGPFPMVQDATKGDRSLVQLASARIYRVSTTDENFVVVVLCAVVDGAPSWAVYCGDHQVSGKFTADGATLLTKLKEAGAPVSASLASLLKESKWVGLVPDLTACPFFRIMERSVALGRGPKFCSHTEGVIFSMLNVGVLSEMEVELQGWLEGNEAEEALVSKAFPEEEAFYSAAFIQPVLLAGERGSGKTYLAREAAARFDAVYLEMQMHPSMEAYEFRAHDRAWNGTVYTVLGKLAEAVYWIQKGKRVVLCMDEFLNMNPVYQTVINSALSLTANDTYLIETGRIIDQGNGIGTVEIVEVPSDMLWVVATSNIGARNGVDKIVPSVRARFMIILMNTNADRTRNILVQSLKKHDMPEELADRFHGFISGCKQAVEESLLDEEATTRLACNVIRFCRKQVNRDRLRISTVKSWIALVKAQLKRECAQVVNFELGPFNPEQEARFNALVDACFVA